MCALGKRRLSGDIVSVRGWMGDDTSTGEDSTFEG